MVFGDMLNKAKEIKDKATDLGKEKLQETLGATLGEIQSLRPILSNCGFIIGDIGISLSIPPSFEIIIKQTRDGLKELEEVEKQEGLTTLQSALISSIKNTYAFSSLFEKYGYFIGKVSIEVGIPPKIHVHLTSLEERH